MENSEISPNPHRTFPAQTRSALITGVSGQVGSYLAEFLLEKGYKVVGMARRCSHNNLERLSKVINNSMFELVEGDVTDFSCVYRLISKHKPDEIYNMAAQSHVATSFDEPEYTFNVDANGPLNFLEVLRQTKIPCRFYQSSTSELFGISYIEKDGKKVQDEHTVFQPQSPYSVAKLAAHHSVDIYRKAYGIFACTGIMFNSESSRRGNNFVTKKITNYVNKLKNWKNQYYVHLLNKDEFREFSVHAPKLKLGNLDAFRDWGYVKDSIECIYRIVQHDKPEDFVISTGETHSIREFLTEAFSLIGIDDWTPFVQFDESLVRPAEVPYLCGDSTKAKTLLNWEHKTSFKELVRIMVKGE